MADEQSNVDPVKILRDESVMDTQRIAAAKEVLRRGYGDLPDAQ